MDILLCSTGLIDNPKFIFERKEEIKKGIFESDKDSIGAEGTLLRKYHTTGLKDLKITIWKITAEAS